MSRIVSHIVDESGEGKRIDTYCAEKGLYPSRSSAAHYIEKAKVFVNGKEVAKRHVVASGDLIVYECFEEIGRTPMDGVDIPLAVIYEDEYLAVISKQSGLVCHPAPNVTEPTLVNALIYRYGRENLAHIQGDDRPGIVHRLDADTSGLMLIAKTDEVGLKLQEAIRDRSIDRRYITLVHGNITADNGLIDAPIARSDHNRLKMNVSDKENARESVTTFSVIERFEAFAHNDGFSLLECKLHSGRTHQIRVHMKYIHHSCVGDPLYGSGSFSSQLGLDRQFLHSYRLSFTHPKTGEELEFRDTLAQDLQEALNSIQSHSLGTTSYGEQINDLWH